MYANLHTIIFTFTLIFFTFSRKRFQIQIYYLLSLLLCSRFFSQTDCKQTAKNVQTDCKKGKD